MKNRNLEQYTIKPEEKEIMDKLNIVDAGVSQNLQRNNSRELILTKYYSEFVINTPNGQVTLNNVFITIEKDKQGEISYHFRWIQKNDNGEQTIEEKIVADEKGNVYTIDGLKDYLGDAEINIEDIMLENEGMQIDENEHKVSRLKGISERKLQNKNEKDNHLKEEQSNDKTNDESQEIEEDLKMQGQDLELTNIRKIKDPHIAERMPDMFEKSNVYAHAYSKKLGKFVMLEKSNQVKDESQKTHSSKGQWQISENIEPAQTTLRTIISIGENGDKIEKSVPHALMKTNRQDKEIAVIIGQYGEVNIETVDVLPCQERVARGVREQGEGLDREESAEVRRGFQTQGKEYTHNLAHQINSIEDLQKENNQIVDYEITEKDYIPNTDITWAELMNETGDSLPELVERYNRDMIKSGGNQEPKSIIQDIIDDYQMISHEHNRIG